jgi:Htaa protein
MAPGGFATTATIVAVAALCTAPAAHGAAGATTLALNGPAAKSLRESGVRIVPLGNAKGGPSQIVLPVRSGLAGATATLVRHRGGILLGAGRTKLRLTSIGLSLGRRSLVTAKTGGQKIDLFRILRGGKRRVDPAAGIVSLGGLKLKLTGAAATLIDRQLDLDPPPEQLRRKRFAGLSTSAAGLLASGGDTPGSTPGGSAGSSGCPLPSGAGPAPDDPPPVASPPSGALNVTSASIDWRVRESFIRYINTGEGTSVSGGATADPPVLLPDASAPLTYDFHFPFAKGWHHSGANPSDPSDDTAAIYFGGAVRFLYSGHGIDLTTAEPELEVKGGDSRAIFSVRESGDPAKRQVLVNLDLSRAAAISASGGTHVYERVPGAIPSGTATSVFAGFYSPGTDFGCFTVRYTTS